MDANTAEAEFIAVSAGGALGWVRERWLLSAASWKEAWEQAAPRGATGVGVNPAWARTYLAERGETIKIVRRSASATDTPRDQYATASVTATFPDGTEMVFWGGSSSPDIDAAYDAAVDSAVVAWMKRLHPEWEAPGWE